MSRIRVFLDSNVIANWILIEEFSANRNTLEEDRILLERFREYSLSHVLTQSFIENNDVYEVFTSTLAIAEVFNVLRKEVSGLKVYRHGFPIVSMFKHLDKALSRDELETIIQVVKDKIDVLKKSGLKELKDELHWEIYPFVVMKGVKTHDALLISTACVNDCDWFITNDRDLIDRLRKEKRKLKLEIDLPESFLKEIS